MKPIIGYEEYFSVTRDGKIYSHRSNKFLKPLKTKKGYLVVSSKVGGRKGKAILLRIHRVVAEAYIANPNNKPFVNHIDCNKENNNIENLEWCTAKENSNHAEHNGLIIHKKGEDREDRKLNNKDIEYIRKYYKARDRVYGSRAMARKFNVSHQVISRIVSFTDWKHI